MAPIVVEYIVPNSAVKFFSCQQASKGILYVYKQQTGNEDAQLTPLLRLGAGACAGIIAMSVTYPMVVRSRLTVQTDKSPYQYRGMFRALSTVLREEGFRSTSMYKVGFLLSLESFHTWVSTLLCIGCGNKACMWGRRRYYRANCSVPS
ncbi:mitochondrial adenine nucleotide transporter ADNT1-like [Forsythia ovata]|uniref:Mitochondrial adenine nucleotide transporter ADNT1-like n=1 Tax=Forsythia ovata TaxID=205694 RepID=A0ABD1TS33_9LAMI